MGCFGEKIEEYEVLEHLGKGGFAHVYRAKCLCSGLFVAIKMIDKALMTRAGMVGRVRQEVTIHSRLKHPSILELYTFFEDAHYVYLVLELAHNGELAKHFRLGTRGLSEQAAADIFKQVVDGVSYLHSHNILHRDLSLNNLLLTKDMRVKIADFGLATQLNEPDEKHVTMCGTPNYISPEVASREYHGLPADVWGLGCMLYTLLVGSPPFHTQHVKSTLNKVINADYKIPKELSPQAQDLLLKLLCRDPSKRITLAGILQHPFLQNDATSCNGRTDFSRDSGFNTTVHSTQHRTRNEDRIISSAHAEVASLNRQNSVEHVNRNTQPASFNVLTGLSDPVYVQSPNTSMMSCSRIPSGLKIERASSAASVAPTLRSFSINNTETINSGILDDMNKLKIKSLNLENKENHAPTHIGVPPLCSYRLPFITHRTRNATLNIKTDLVTVEFIKKKGKDREERLTDVCKISSDGMKIIVYSIEGGRGKPLSCRDEIVDKYQPTQDEVFTYHNLPQKHWKKYLYAARFVDLVKAKTPKITLYSPFAKCQLMENGVDFEAFFYNGEKISIASNDGLKIIDKNGLTYKEVTEEIEASYKHFNECLQRCRKVENALASTGDECFPLIIGKRPINNISKPFPAQTTPTSATYHTPVVNIGSFHHGSSSSRAESEYTQNKYLNPDQRQILERRLPFQALNIEGKNNIMEFKQLI